MYDHRFCIDSVGDCFGDDIYEHLRCGNADNEDGAKGSVPNAHRVDRIGEAAHKAQNVEFPSFIVKRCTVLKKTTKVGIVHHSLQPQKTGDWGGVEDC